MSFQIVNCTTRHIDFNIYNQNDSSTTLQILKFIDLPTGRAANGICLARTRPFFGQVWISNDLVPGNDKVLMRVYDGTRYFVTQVRPHKVHCCPRLLYRFYQIGPQLTRTIL